MRSSISAFFRVLPFVLLAAIAAAVPCAAHQSGSAPRAVTSADYQRAEKFLPFNTTPLVYHSGRATWLKDDRFWLRDTSADGSEFLLYDAAKGTHQPAFDHAKLATALSAAAGATYDAKHLPFMTFEFSDDEKSISFDAKSKSWTCDLQSYTCAEEKKSASARSRREEELSPNGKLAAFIKDYNLWVRDLASGKETQLTTDGVKDFGYATDNAGWIHSDRPVLLWSPDSMKIATFQQDQRGVGEMYLVESRVGHPILQAWKYPLPGDDVVTTIQRVIVAVNGPKVIRLQLPPDQHRSTLCDDVECRGQGWEDVEWSADGSHLAFVSTSRDHKHEQLRVADTATGAVRDVLDKTVATQYESGQGRANWHYLPASNEIIWYSERTNWGHLYLYDLTTGQLKHEITSGDWVVTQVLRVDEKNRFIYFLANGRENGENPYFAHLYRIGFDGRDLTLLTPESGNHEISFSHSGRFFFDRYSKPDVPPIAVLRDDTGKIVADVAKTDISKLLATGWQPPTPIMVKARDGVTDLFGLMYKPTNLDPTKKYPIINSIYPGPQGGSVGSPSFSPARGDCQALAELGFIVVQIDGMGNPMRSKKFHDFYYGNMGDNTLPDQIAAMKELPQKYPWIDIDRAGVWGHSGGGFAAADAMFRYPDFFKVGISESGNHDNREYEDDWGERYQGLLVKNADGATNYDDQANENIAKNLKGHLLLAHGTLDDNVPPYNTLLVVEALIKANKDFDLLLLPNQHHGYGSMSLYMMRRRWDYFVRYLLDAEPPHEFEIKPPKP
ncbi:MAG TPA: DPP IV N-terminal domain-containing protein [Candidatus Methylomirabilis sp.]|nr:DPP IV N-terminal domain-containing protein [Candidatus Methylomirabilis sp.]